MTEDKKIKENKLSELKVVLAIIFIVLGFIYVPKDRVLVFTGFVSALIFLLGKYINNNGLRVARALYYLFISFYHVSSLAYVIEYLRESDSLAKTFEKIFYPFMVNEKIDIRYIIFILLFTSFILIYGQKIKNPGAKKYGR